MGGKRTGDDIATAGRGGTGRGGRGAGRSGRGAPLNRKTAAIGERFKGTEPPPPDSPQSGDSQSPRTPRTERREGLQSTDDTRGRSVGLSPVLIAHVPMLPVVAFPPLPTLVIPYSS